MQPINVFTKYTYVTCILSSILFHLNVGFWGYCRRWKLSYEAKYIYIGDAQPWWPELRNRDKYCIQLKRNEIKFGKSGWGSDIWMVVQFQRIGALLWYHWCSMRTGETQNTFISGLFLHLINTPENICNPLIETEHGVASNSGNVHPI